MRAHGRDFGSGGAPHGPSLTRTGAGCHNEEVGAPTFIDRAKKLSRKLVDAARLRMESSMGALSVRAALLADTRSGVTDVVISQWMQRGEELRVENLSSADEHLPEYDRLCLLLVELDTTCGSRALQLAGEAMEDLLRSRDVRTAGPRVALIKHVQASLGGDRFVQRQIVEHRVGDLDFSQAQMDALSREELLRYEEIVKQRAALADELRAMASLVASRGTAAIVSPPTPTVH